MTVTIFTIAALHALPPLIGAIIYRRVGWFCGILIGIGFAACTGASIYTFTDIIGVIIGAYLGYSFLTNK